MLRDYIIYLQLLTIFSLPLSFSQIPLPTPVPPGAKINLKVVHVSDMARAKETADIIVKEIENGMIANGDDNFTITRSNPDPNLNEGRPCHVIPSGECIDVETVRRDGPRIETAFRKYFYREQESKSDKRKREKEFKKIQAANNKGDKEDSLETATTKPITTTTKQVDEPNPAADATIAPPKHQHNYEIIICHGNVIRYFFMRAMQLPPEAWLRLCTFNCSLTYFTIRPEGGVSCRLMGDIGHLDMDEVTFSGHHGYNW